MITFLNRCIRWLFYALFFFVPLIVVSDTSELFEFNKLWLTFIITILIGALWISKMILQKRIFIQRTPLDIPIILFLLSQTISTIFSIDPHVSWWGYYSRFNGGLLSLLCYAFLYYALASNSSKQFISRIIFSSLLSGLVVSLWGLPSHFGYDPTCYLFRGTLDVSCWTAAFQPKIRIFSTLGQPDWLAAYLSILLPIALALGINAWQKRNKLLILSYSLLAILFYIDILFTRSKGTFLSLVVALPIFLIGYWWTTKKQAFKPILIIVGLGLLITLIVQTPFDNVNKYISFPAKTILTKQTATSTSQKTATPTLVAGELGGTDSGKIRLFVWQGALKIWQHYPLFGSGTETFAFAYYMFRPAGHNMTSEWDYLYNKAHNEYLNYLATTGIFGLGTYLVIIGFVLFYTVKFLLKNTSVIPSEVEESLHQTSLNRSLHSPNGSVGMTKNNSQINLNNLLILGILSGYITILVSNFFGFSVVMVNIYFFLIPTFIFALADKLDGKKIIDSPHGTGQWLGTTVVWIVGIYLIAILINYWFTDKSYALGHNLDQVGQYQMALKPLTDAVNARPDEPVYSDELATNNATLALAYANQKDSSTAAQFAKQALTLSGQNITNYPNNVLFWKTRVRVLYVLSQLDPQYLPATLQAIQKAHQLAPTDAKVDYNLGLIYQQNGQLDNAIKTFQETIKLKPDYRDAYYALGLTLHQQATDNSGKVINQTKQKQAIDTLQYTLKNVSIGDPTIQKTLQAWGVL